MKTRTMITSLDKLDPETKRLCEESLLAREKSYSPYSQFKVGAAILCSDNKTNTTVTGCNVENASYGLTVCAERTAVTKAVSEGYTEMVSVAIAADLDEEFVGPCGMCRQTLAEFNPEIRIFLVRLDGAVQVSDLNTLLPEAFSPKKLSFKFHNGNC